MGCEDDSFEDDLADLSSAEDFLDYFGIAFDARIVQVNRLHILQRYHDYLAKQEAGKTPDYAAYRTWLARAYEDFVGSSAQQEKVFAVFQKADGSSFVPLSSLTAATTHSSLMAPITHSSPHAD
ncbi:MAG TPA: nitrogenase-stabilizing/protective protein NifW [Rhodocyclaceae bacterium]|nr:nitrogenase-stabilizing/protective protein NifW [Rhodocyclaceae bacterium]